MAAGRHHRRLSPASHCRASPGGAAAWSPLATALARAGADGLAARDAHARRLCAEDGVGYRPPGVGDEQPWAIDPVPLLVPADDRTGWNARWPSARSCSTAGSPAARRRGRLPGVRAPGGLRSVGLAARYVSGYLETRPPPGRPRVRGADASHAWVSGFTGDGWFDVDPTNDRTVDDAFVELARGRDYADVPPLRGVIFSAAAESELRVAVDLIRLDG